MTNRLLPILAIIIAVLIFFGYVSSAWSGSIKSTRAAIESDDQALAAATQYAAQQNSLAAARDDIDPAQLARLEVFLPDSVDNVGLILDLNALAARAGLSLSKIDVAADSSQNGIGNQGPVASVDLSLSAIGSYSALQNFLRGIERSARLLDLRDLTVRGSETGVYTYQMKIRLYWLR